MFDQDLDLATLIADMEKETSVEEIPASEPEEVMEDDVLVEEIITPVVKYKLGDEVMLIPGAKYVTGSDISSNMFNTKLYIRQVFADNKYSIGLKTTGRIAGKLDGKYLTAYKKDAVATVDGFEPYIVIIRDEQVDVKARPDANSKTLKTLHKGSLFTVVGEKNDWGHLKIGGWIPFEQFKKLIK